MKLFCIAVVLATCGRAADPVEHPATPKRVWVRRITLGAACAASLGFDTVSTHRAVIAGAVETNGLLADSQGRPQWGRVIGIKAGACAASAFLQERHYSWSSPRSDWTFTGVNLSTTAAYAFVGIRNLKLANDLGRSQ